MLLGELIQQVYTPVPVAWSLEVLVSGLAEKNGLMILRILGVSAKHTPAPFLMVKKDFFFEKKNESLILASVYSTIGTQVSREVRNNCKNTKTSNLSYSKLKENQCFSQNQLYLFLIFTLMSRSLLDSI